jgi:hypothetical protein
MSRHVAVFCSVAAALTVAACTAGPSPESSFGIAPSGSLSAKPGGGTPPSTPHSLTFAASRFGDPGFDGYPSPGYATGTGTVLGWFTGPNASGWYKAAASGAYSLTITDVDELPDDAAGGNPCTEPEQDFLRGIGLVAAQVSGTLTLSIGERKIGSAQQPVMTWELSDIAVESGYTWTVTGASGSTNPLFFPQFDGSTPGAELVATVENGRAHFTRYPSGSRRSDLFIACRTDLTMTLTKQ